MGWETRNGRGDYYTRSRRVGGRVVREYVGSGELAWAISILDLAERHDRERALEQRKAEREREDALDAELSDYFGRVEEVARGALEAAGYRRHKRGEWRKRRADRDRA